MADVFKKEDARSLLKGKHIFFVGDKNMRALYQDVLWLYQQNSLISLSALRRRPNKSFLGDRVIACSQLKKGCDFTEHRIFEDDETKIEFRFITRSYDDNIIKEVTSIKDGTKHCPDVILMNSCSWDFSRRSPRGVKKYKSNMDKFMKLLTSSLPKHVLFIWGTALPILGHIAGYPITKQIKFMEAMLRVRVIEANSLTASLASSHGFDVLDFYHYMRNQIIRSADGINFFPTAMRVLSSLFLTRIALSWDVTLPGHLKNWTLALASKIEHAIEASSAKHETKEVLNKMETLEDTLNKNVAATPNKQKRKKKNKKMQNKRVENPVKWPEVMSPNNGMQPDGVLKKTPPNYHKASPVIKRTLDHLQNNYYIFPIANNLPSASNCPGHNFKITRQCDVEGTDDSARFAEDFCPTGFEDFNDSSNVSNDFDMSFPQPCSSRHVYAPNPDCYNPNQAYFPVELQTIPMFPSYYNNDVNPYDRNNRYNKYRNHPYENSRDDRTPWGNDDTYQHNNPGPMRRRKPSRKHDVDALY